MLGSDLMSRYALIGWLLQTTQSAIPAQLAKLVRVHGCGVSVSVNMPNR